MRDDVCSPLNHKLTSLTWWTVTLRPKSQSDVLYKRIFKCGIDGNRCNQYFLDTSIINTVPYFNWLKLKLRTKQSSLGKERKGRCMDLRLQESLVIILILCQDDLPHKLVMTIHHLLRSGGLVNALQPTTKNKLIHPHPLYLTQETPQTNIHLQPHTVFNTVQHPKCRKYTAVTKRTTHTLAATLKLQQEINTVIISPSNTITQRKFEAMSLQLFRLSLHVKVNDNPE